VGDKAVAEFCPGLRPGPLVLVAIDSQIEREHYANEPSMVAMPMKIDQTTKNRLWRFLLGSAPFMRGVELYDLLSDVRKSQADFDQQVTEAVGALQNTSALVSRLQQGVEERMSKLQQLREEHEKYSQLAQIEGKKAEALVSQLKATLENEQRKERWIAFGMHFGFGLLFFVLGVVASDSVKEWLDHVWIRMTR